jgi:hypothetical protein
MLDTYREMEQRGAHATLHPDHVRVEWPSGSRWLYYNDHTEYRGPSWVTIKIAELPPRAPWWRVVLCGLREMLR